MKRNILITGGAGFIGSHVVELMVRKYPDYHIVTLDKLTYAGSLDNLTEVADAPNHTFVEGDITDAELVADIFARYAIDGVMHLAAESHVDRSISAPMVFAQNNILGTITLLEAARKAWSGNYECKRFHHISTDEVYGALSLDAMPHTRPTQRLRHHQTTLCVPITTHTACLRSSRTARTTMARDNIPKSLYRCLWITSSVVVRYPYMAQVRTYATGSM